MIRLNKDFTDWGWFHHSEMVHLMIYMLINAYEKDGFWEDIPVKRGQLITSLRKIESQTGMSVRKVRTCLQKLCASECIEMDATNLRTIITIRNYEGYCDGSMHYRPVEQVIEANNKHEVEVVDAIEETEKVEVVKNTINLHGLVDDLMRQEVALNAFCMQNRITTHDFATLAFEVINEWELQGLVKTNISEAKKHLFNTIRIKIKNKASNGNKTPTKEERYAEFYAHLAEQLSRPDNSAEEEAELFKHF